MSLMTRYLLFPLGFMVYFGDPAWYDKYVLPVCPSVDALLTLQHRHRFEPPANEFVRTIIHSQVAPSQDSK